MVDKGFAVAFDSGYLIVRDIPYLDSEGKPLVGTIVTKLEFIDKERVIQGDHTILFAGGVPYGLDGRPVPNLGGGPTSLPLTEVSKDVVVQRSFSNKPQKTGRYENFYDKIESYVTQISGPAMERFGANPYTFRTVRESSPNSVFKSCDTLTSRAEILDLAAPFKDDVVAVIGLGGTGAYLLDFLVKTPVREIRAFDFDPFHVHNAFRSPGRLDADELGKLKPDVYKVRYENFRTGLTVQRKFIDSSSIDEVKGVTFAFICVDKGSARAGIFDLLISQAIPFIDVGMGLNRKLGALSGMVRTTYYPVDVGPLVRSKAFAQMADSPEDGYRNNIQISELNALNASLAIIRFKQLRGFYHAAPPYYNLLFDIADLKAVGVDNLNEG